MPLYRLNDFKKYDQNNVDTQCTFVWKKVVNKIHDESNVENPTKESKIHIREMQF